MVIHHPDDRHDCHHQQARPCYVAYVMFPRLHIQIIPRTVMTGLFLRRHSWFVVSPQFVYSQSRTETDDNLVVIKIWIESFVQRHELHKQTNAGRKTADQVH